MAPHTGLMVIDVQVGMFDPEGPVDRSDELLSVIASLIERARASGTLVVYVQHCGSGGSGLERDSAGWPIHPRIEPRPGDWVIEKSEPDSFQGTDLDARLKSAGITHLVMVGIATEYCFDTTVRSGYARGYRVVAVADGHATWDSDDLAASQIVAHHNRTLERFAEIRQAREVEFS